MHEFKNNHRSSFQSCRQSKISLNQYFPLWLVQLKICSSKLETFIFITIGRVNLKYWKKSWDVLSVQECRNGELFFFWFGGCFQFSDSNPWCFKLFWREIFLRKILHQIKSRNAQGIRELREKSNT
jgi:hypothetical protein